MARSPGGVLDRLIEEHSLVLASISGTSAGAMNAVALSSGLMEGGREGVRTALRRLWERVGGMGLIGGAVMLGFGWWWLSRRAAAARRAREGYGADDATPAQPDAVLVDVLSEMPFGLAIAPVVLVIALNYLLATWLWPALDTSYLADARFGATSVQAVRGIWAVIGALSAAIVLLAVLWWLAQRARRGKGIGLKVVLEEGAGASVMHLMNTASQVGFGAVIASLAGFALIRDAVLGIAPGNRWCPCRSRSTSWRASPARHRVA